MSNPYDPAQQHQQQWGQPSYPQPPAQPAPPAQIDWHSGPPQPERAPWRGPAAFAPPAPAAPVPAATPVPATPVPAPAEDDAPQQFVPPAGHEQPWVAAGAAQTAQEVADHWQSAQEAQQVATPQAAPAEAPVAEHYQPPAQSGPAPAAASAAPLVNPPAPVGDQQAPQQWPAYDAPAQQQSTATSEAATATTPAVAEPAGEPEPEALTIGRGRDNSIVLDDMLVSRQHVRITADADGLVLEDLGSRNGTYVNGRRVERTHLSEGDRIGIGVATFEVRDGWLLNV